MAVGKRMKILVVNDFSAIVSAREIMETRDLSAMEVGLVILLHREHEGR